MNELDLRLREELHRGDAEIDVTEEDLRHAEHRFLRRRHELRLRHRTWTAVGVAAATVAAVAGGSVLVQTLGEPEIPPAEQDDIGLPTPDDPTRLSEENLSGTYMLDDQSGWVWTFADDNVSISNPGDSQSGSTVFPYSLSGTQMTWPTGQCVLEAALDGQGVLELIVVQAPKRGAPPGEYTYCPGPRGFSLTRLTPESPAGAALEPISKLPDEPAGLEHLRQIRGAWLKEGTGMLLTITGEVVQGSVGGGPVRGELYYELDDAALDAGAPDDHGAAVLDGQGGLVLTSSQRSAGCSAASSVTLSKVHIWAGMAPVGYPALSVRMEVDSANSSGCAVHADLAGTWVRVS